MKSDKKDKKSINIDSETNNLNDSDEEKLRIEVEKFILGAEEAMKNNEIFPEAEMKLKEKQKAREILFREIISDKNYDNLLNFIIRKVIRLNFIFLFETKIIFVFLD